MLNPTPLEAWIAANVNPDRPSEPLTRSRIETWQLERMRGIISHAKTHSPFYHHHLKDITPDSIQHFDDLSSLPFTTPDDLRTQPLQFLCVSQDDIARCITLQSTGTSGKPKRIFLTRNDLEQTLDFFHHGMTVLITPGDRVMIFLPGDRPDSVGDLLSRALARMNVPGIIQNPGVHPEHIVDAIIDQSITCLVGAPVFIRYLLRCGTGETRLKNRIQSILLTTDHIPQVIVNTLEQALTCRVYGHYGMSEMGWGGGVACRAGRGYHFREADLYIEIVSPETGAPLPDGQIGEIVVTTLTRTGMPLIRYRTGDISRFHRPPCPCGTVLKQMDRSVLRLENRALLKSGAYLTLSMLDEALFSLPDVIDFQAELGSCSGRDSLTIAADISGDADSVCDQIKGKLKTIPAIRDAVFHLDIQLSHHLNNPDFLPGFQKRCLVDHRKKDDG